MTPRAAGNPGAGLETGPDCGEGTVVECLAQPAAVMNVMSSVTSGFTGDPYTKARSRAQLARVSYCFD